MNHHADLTANIALGSVSREWNQMARLALRIRQSGDSEWAQRESRRFTGIYKRLLTDPISSLKQKNYGSALFGSNGVAGMVVYATACAGIVLMLMFDTGLRISEIMDMKPEQIRQGYITVYGKGRKERVVPQDAIVSK